MKLSPTTPVREQREMVVGDARAIIRSGTTQGLGELEGGPTENTHLGAPATVRLHPLQVIAQQDVEESLAAS